MTELETPDGATEASAHRPPGALEDLAAAERVNEEAEAFGIGPVSPDSDWPYSARPPASRPVRRLLASVVPGALAVVVLFGVWQVFVDADHISRTELVAPSAVFAEMWHHPGFYVSNGWVTLQEAFWGFLAAFVVAIAIALLVAHSRLADRAASPVITIWQVTPVLVLAPPLVVWLGFGPGPKIVIAALITFVPLVVNAITGFRAIDPATLELLRSVNASRREIFFRLRLPHSIPYLVAAVRICVGLALIGATVAEFTAGSSAGIGYIIVYDSNYLVLQNVWGAIFTLVLMGVVGVGVTTVIGNGLLRWREGQRRPLGVTYRLSGAGGNNPTALPK